jgi:hypothetical protein
MTRRLLTETCSGEVDEPGAGLPTPDVPGELAGLAEFVVVAEGGLAVEPPQAATPVMARMTGTSKTARWPPVTA